MTNIAKPLPEFFTLEDGVVCFRPIGEATLDRAVELVDGAIRFCRENQIRGLFASTFGLNGISMPSTADRYFFVSQWAETGGGSVVLSMSVQPELLDPDRIGITMAANRGLRAHVSSDESDALAWLKGAISSMPDRQKTPGSIL